MPIENRKFKKKFTTVKKKHLASKPCDRNAKTVSAFSFGV